MEKNKESTLRLFSPEQFPCKNFEVYSSSQISDLSYYWSILPMFIYSSISFALIVKENRSHKYSLKIFPSRPGELSVFSLNFPHKFNISAICQAVFEFCQNWKHFQRGRKTNRLLEGSLLNELLPTPKIEDSVEFHMIWKSVHREIFQSRKFPYSQILKRGQCC